MILAQSLLPTIAVTAPCASLIWYNNLPDCGANARIFPSLHPEMMLPPSGMNATQLHVTFGTFTRSNSLASFTCHTLTSLLPAVMNTSEYPTGNAMSLMISW
jgi:hypothetical protein